MTERLHLVQSSMRNDRPSALQRLAARDVFDLEADAIGFTEAHHAPVAPAIAAEAARAGYHLHDPARGDGIIAVHPRHTIISEGYVHVLDANGGMPKGNYGSRGIAYVTFRTPVGNVVTFHEAHWITAYNLDSRPGPESRRESRHTEQTLAMIAAVKEHGSGKRLSFWAGDTNIDEQRDRGTDTSAPHHLFTKARLVSIFDALAKTNKGDDFPGTRGSKARSATIDIIGHYARDTRVQPIKFKVHGPRPGSDHNVVEAFYGIKPPRFKKKKRKGRP